MSNSQPNARLHAESHSLVLDKIVGAIEAPNPQDMEAWPVLKPAKASGKI